MNNNMIRKKIHEESGSVLVAALMVMMLLTLIGVAATNKTGTELAIAANDRNYEGAIEAAEAGLLYVIADHSEYYGGDNIDPDNPLDFNSNDSTLPASLVFDGTATYFIGTDAGGKVIRGTGQSHGKFKMHSYFFESRGEYGGARKSVASLKAKGYRLGF